MKVRRLILTPAQAASRVQAEHLREHLAQRLLPGSGRHPAAARGVLRSRQRPPVQRPGELR